MKKAALRDEDEVGDEAGEALMGIIETEAVVLRVYKLADADKIVIALTRDAGLIRGVARGARKLKSRFGAALEPYTLSSLQYYEKENRELVSLRQAEVLRSHFDLVRSEGVYNALQYIGELTIEFVPPREPNALMFRMLRACLEAMADEPARYPLVVRYFEVWLLKLAGLLPDDTVCGGCNRQLETSEPAFYRTGEAVYCQLCTSNAGRTLSLTLREQLRLARTSSPTQFMRLVERSYSDATHEIEEFAKPLIIRALERDISRQKAISTSAL
ncbi:MAG: DNA repair protein RecO [Pyrinomonadaceae bacterium]